MGKLRAAAVAGLALWTVLAPTGAAGRSARELPSSGPVAAIALSNTHSCLLTTGGGVKCWGDNSHGELGDGTTTNSLTPVDVSGLTSGVAAIGVGAAASCAVTTAGGLKCWGYNAAGQLGDGTTTERHTPVDVSGLTSGVSAVTGGSLFTCALMSAGGVKCWGENFFGQLGDGTRTQHLTPVDVAGLSATTITTGYDYACALTTAGGAKCWGGNCCGQIGDGTQFDDRLLPVDVVDLSTGVASIAAGGSHTCAVTTVGGAKCWGSNSDGEVGDGTTQTRLVPVDVSGLTSGVAATALGGTHTCALTTAGGAKCWGSNANGELGDGTTAPELTPVDVSGLPSGVAALTGADHYTCALQGTGYAKCWGANGAGQLGDGTTTERHTPVDVAETLTVNNVGDGGGVVLSTPPGIDCGTTACVHSFPFGGPVTLTATPLAGSYFVGWSGDCSGKSACNLTMSELRSATATFRPLPCIVPHVIGRPLSTAKKRIRKSHCTVGRVSYVVSTRKQFHRVMSELPKPGRRFAPGRKVNLKVGKGPRR